MTNEQRYELTETSKGPNKVRCNIHQIARLEELRAMGYITYGMPHDDHEGQIKRAFITDAGRAALAAS